jgi:hypothetical protein
MLPTQDVALKHAVGSAGGALLVQLAADADADLGRERDALWGEEGVVEREEVQPWNGSVVGEHRAAARTDVWEADAK